MILNMNTVCCLPLLSITRHRALADILPSALCCHSNETCAPIANPPNSAELAGTPYHSPKLHLDPCSSVGMRQGKDTQTSMTNIHLASAASHAKCNSKHRTVLFGNPCYLQYSLEDVLCCSTANCIHNQCDRNMSWGVATAQPFTLCTMKPCTVTGCCCCFEN